MITKANIKKTVNKTIKLIENGWCRNSYDKKIGKKDHYCIVGALNKAAPKVSYNVQNAIQEYLDKTLDYHKCILAFNDEAKDKRVVIKMLKQFLKTLE